MSTTVDLGKITASVTVGTTTTGAAGTNASVSNSGTTQDAVLNFTIPRGAQGVQGPQGNTGPQGPAGPTGPQGPMGDVAVITPEQQAAFTMYSVPGQNTDGPMTQKAVTDALVASAISYDNSQSGLAAENVQGALDEVMQKSSSYKTLSSSDLYGRSGFFINSSQKWQAANYSVFIPAKAGATYILNIGQTKVYAFLKSMGIIEGGTPQFADGTTSRIVTHSAITIVTLPNNSDTQYIYVGSTTTAQTNIGAIIEVLPDSVTVSKLKNLTETPALIDTSTFLSTSTYLISSGNVWASSSSATGAFIPVIGGKKYRIFNDNTGSSKLFAWLQNNTIVVGQQPNWAIGNSGRSMLANNMSTDEVAPSNANFLYIGTSGALLTVYELQDSSDAFVKKTDIASTVEKDNTNPVSSDGVYSAIEFAGSVKKEISLISGSAVRNGGNIGDTASLQVDTNTSTVSWCYGIISCQKGEKYLLNGYAGNTYRIYSILDSNNTILDVSVGVHSETSAYHDKIIEIPANGVKLVININEQSGFSSIQKLLSVDEYIGDEVLGYERSYNNITGLLTFERKSISSGGIVDNPNTLLAKLPNIGAIEVRLNRPAGSFSVWKKSGNTITELYADNYYQYRYVGDYESEYYVMATSATQGGTAQVSQISVYNFSDEGKVYNQNLPSWLKGKTVAFMGDSIVQGRTRKLANSGVNICMDEPWPNIIAEIVGDMNFTNFAIGGAYVYNDGWSSLSANVSKVVGYDVVFICAGTNDYGNKISKTNFESAYTTVLNTLIANNTKVVVMTPTHRTTTVSNPAMPFDGYCASITNIATNAGCVVIPLHTLTNTTEFINNLVDGLHPNEIGSRIIAKLILDNLNE